MRAKAKAESTTVLLIEGLDNNRNQTVGPEQGPNSPRAGSAQGSGRARGRCVWKNFGGRRQVLAAVFQGVALIS